MQVYILDPDYNTLGMIDAAESVLWNPKYNDIGECEIYIPCEEEYLSMLRRGHYVYRFDDDMFCKIERFEIETDVENGDYIIATAKDICSILAGRIVRWQIVFSGTFGQFIQKVLNDNVIKPEQSQRAIPHFEFDDSNIEEFGEFVEVSTFADDLLQLILTACKTYNVGFRVSFNMETRKLVFRLYRGKNKASITGEEYVEFSPEFANILASNYAEDDASFKNVVYVGYKGENEIMQLFSLYKGEAEPQGEERREIYVDGTSTSRDIIFEELKQMFPAVQRNPVTMGSETSGYYYITVNSAERKVATFEVSTTDGVKSEKITVTDYTYLLLIRAIGENALAAQVMTQSFVGDVDTIDTYEYKVDYNLGDIVKVINEYGIEAEARITEIMESEDAENGYSIEPKFEYLN
jgi:hypothetical protein